MALITKTERKGTEMANRKVHLIANKLTGSNVAYALCASKPVGNGKVRRNSRSSYQFMASELVPLEGFKATPAADRCAHCVEQYLIKRNKARAEKGWKPVDSVDAPAGE